jgi:two-component system KDP operon response regulator KdpE
VVVNALAGEFSRVLEAANAREGLDLAAANKPDLVVLDLGLPDEDGKQVCSELRKWFNGAILVLSARHSDAEKIDLLNGGADDYLTKPFNTLELKARAVALLRRTTGRSATGDPVVRSGDLVLDLNARSLTVRGKRLHLTPTEWSLLSELMINTGRTLTHRQLFSAGWPNNAAGDAQQYLRVHIANIRRKIEDDPLQPKYIITEPGVGYRFLAGE